MRPQISAFFRQNKLLLAAGLVVLGAIILASAYSGWGSPARPSAEVADLGADQGGIEDPLAQTETVAPERPAQAEPTPAAEFAIVYISGAIRHPDVYRVPAAARVKDVVVAAGGLTEDAATDQINLAERVADAQHIHIPRQGETSPAPAPSDESASAADQNGALNINTASAADLDGLPGIGQSIAARIVEYRTANGPFKSVEDLRQVKGIGPALFAKIAALVTVGP